jgi:hypothetical protein
MPTKKVFFWYTDNFKYSDIIRDSTKKLRDGFRIKSGIR